MATIDSLIKRLGKLTEGLPEPDDRLIAHLPDWQKEQLAIASHKRTLYRKLELLSESASMSEEEYNAAIEEAAQRSPEEVAALRWYAKKYPEGRYEGAKEILLQKLSVMHESLKNNNQDETA